MISDVPLLILANKIDKRDFAGEDEIRHFFALYNLTTGKVMYNVGLISNKSSVTIVLTRDLSNSIKGRIVAKKLCSQVGVEPRLFEWMCISIVGPMWPAITFKEMRTEVEGRYCLLYTSPSPRDS